MLIVLLSAACLLALGLSAWADEGEGGEGTEGDPPPAAAKNTDTGEPMIPKRRLDEVLARVRALEKEKSEWDAQAAKDTESKLAEQQKFQELAATREKERDVLKAQLVEVQNGLRLAELRARFVDAAVKAKIPADRANDAFILADWPDESEGEPDVEAVVKALLKEKPWLAQVPGVPNFDAGSGRGNGPNAEEAQLKAQIEGAAKKYLPPTMGMPASPA